MPIIASIIAAVIAAIAATVSAVQAENARQAQITTSARNARLQRAQVQAQFNEKEQAAAQRKLELSRMALAARGTAQASNLGDRSVRAIGRAIGFELGQDKATVTKNQEIAQREAGARLMGIDITRITEKQQIGDHSGLQMGLEIGGAWLGAIGQVASAASQSAGQTSSGPEQVMATSDREVNHPAFNSEMASIA